MQHYYEAYSKSSGWHYKVYRYNGDQEVRVAWGGPYYSREEAEDSAIDWLDNHPDIDATLA